MASGIYIIVCLVSGNRYVGSAVNIAKRWDAHRNDLIARRHGNRHLQRAWDKYGAESFAFHVLEEVNDSADLIGCEQIWIDELKPEYNMAPTAGSMLGFLHSEATKLRISEAKSGKSLTAEHRRKISEALQGITFPERQGVPLTEEHRRKVSEALQGRSPTEEHRRKLAEANTGKVFSEERRQAISKGRAGIAPEKTQEHLDHIAVALRDKYATDEEFQASVKRAQEASAEARRGKELTDEHKRKVSESLKGKKRPPRTPEQIERYRQAALKRMADPARRAALSRTMKEKGIAPSDEARAKAQATAKRG